MVSQGLPAGDVEVRPRPKFDQDCPAAVCMNGMGVPLTVEVQQRFSQQQETIWMRY
jgi:hypothetical protein